MGTIRPRKPGMLIYCILGVFVFVSLVSVWLQRKLQKKREAKFEYSAFFLFFFFLFLHLGFSKLEKTCIS